MLQFKFQLLQQLVVWLPAWANLGFIKAITIGIFPQTSSRFNDVFLYRVSSSLNKHCKQIPKYSFQGQTNIQDDPKNAIIFTMDLNFLQTHEPTPRPKAKWKHKQRSWKRIAAHKQVKKLKTIAPTCICMLDVSLSTQSENFFSFSWCLVLVVRCVKRYKLPHDGKDFSASSGQFGCDSVWSGSERWSQEERQHNVHRFDWWFGTDPRENPHRDGQLQED